MTGRELRELLSHMPADMEIILRVRDEDGLTWVAGLETAEVEQGCADCPAILLDGAIDPDDDGSMPEDHADGAP